MRLHYPDISGKLLDACLTEFYRLRDGGFEKPPATAELLDWVGAVRWEKMTPGRVQAKPFGMSEHFSRGPRIC